MDHPSFMQQVPGHSGGKQLKHLELMRNVIAIDYSAIRGSPSDIYCDNLISDNPPPAWLSDNAKLQLDVPFYSITCLGEWIRRPSCALHGWFWWMSLPDYYNLFSPGSVEHELTNGSREGVWRTR